MSYFNDDHPKWLEDHYTVRLSDIGRKAAYITGTVFKGLYNSPFELSWTDWKRETHIQMVTDGLKSDLATFDGNSLTNIVLFAHELRVRVSISPVVLYCRVGTPEKEFTDGFTYNPIEQNYCSDDGPDDYDYAKPGLEFFFHQRQHDGGIGARHPSMEDALEGFRRAFGETGRSICSGRTNVKAA